MPTLEERVAFLEGRVGEQGRAVDGIREAVIQVEHRLHAFEERMEHRLHAFEGRVDRRFEGVELRLTGLDEKITRYFVWMVGIQVTTLAAIVTALATR